MEKTRTRNTQRNNVIRASEINQYTYCSVSWFLQKKGYEPQSPALETGKNTHKHLGVTIDSLEKEQHKSQRLSLIGYLLIAVIVIIILIEVIL
ncbi:MAG: hypothetical protein NT038_08475 [Euryarchaeota archaeon]|nr:hypothetical protein [Euryarchaeota archaeon]